jgi:hypothetical protein
LHETWQEHWGPNITTLATSKLTISLIERQNCIQDTWKHVGLVSNFWGQVPSEKLLKIGLTLILTLILGFDKK